MSKLNDNVDGGGQKLNQKVHNLKLPDNENNRGNSQPKILIQNELEQDAVSGGSFINGRQSRNNKLEK